MKKLITLLSSFLFLLVFTSVSYAEFRAGAAVVSVTPDKMPAIINGGMLPRIADKVKTPVNARAIVMDDGKEKIAIVVVDSCMIPKIVADDAKALAQ